MLKRDGAIRRDLNYKAWSIGGEGSRASFESCSLVVLGGAYLPGPTSRAYASHLQKRVCSKVGFSPGPASTGEQWVPGQVSWEAWGQPASHHPKQAILQVLGSPGK